MPCGATVGRLYVCYDVLARDTGGFTIRFYVNSTGFSWDDDQTLTIDGSNGVHYVHSYHASAPEVAGARELTHIDIGFPAAPGACVNFGALVGGVYAGWAPRVDGTDCASPNVPGAPGTSVDSITSSSARVVVTAPGSNGGAGIDAYETIVRLNNNAGQSQTKTGGTATFTGLTRATAYETFARAHNAAGWGPYSGDRDFTTLSTIPSVPGTPVASAITAASATASWTAPTDNGGQTISSYTLQVASTSNFAAGSIVHESTANNLSRPVTGLTKVTPYYMRVAATNSVGGSNWSGTGTFTTLPTVPGAPTITGVSSITPTSAAVSWSPPADNGGQTITAYDVQYSTDPTYATNTVTQSTGTLSNLTPGATYHVRVRAKNASGDGPWSDTISVTTFTTQTGMKVYNGTAWVDAPVYAYDGAAWVACEVRIYNGTAWVPTG